MRRLLEIIVLIALTKGFWMAFLLLQSEMHPAHHGWDGAIYTAVGRGILNGLTPYVDLFETKPPGMYLISALSLWLFDDIRLGNILQGFVEIGLVMALLLPLLRVPSWLRRQDRLLFLAVTLVFGILLMAYTVERAGHFQSETFGTFLLTLYGALLFLTRGTKAWLRILGSTLCIALAIGIKEPFLFIALAICIIAVPRWRDWPRAYVLPLAAALAVGTLVMLLLGYLQPYLSIYLPEMIIGRAGYFGVPVWYYVFLANYPLQNIAQFSMPLVIAVTVLWFASLAYSAHAWESLRKAMSLFLSVGLFAALIAGLGIVVRKYAGQQDVADTLLFLSLSAVVLFIAIVVPLVRRFLGGEDASDVLSAVMRYIAALVLTLFVMGSGGFLTQHYGFPVALYAVLFMIFTLHTMEHWDVPFHRWMYMGVALLACAGVLLLPTSGIMPALQERIAAEDVHKNNARTIDLLMDSCGFDRYLMFAVNVPYEHTRHSPFGPGFHRPEFSVPVSWRPPPIPYLQEGFQASVESTSFVILPREQSKEMPEKLAVYILEHFTQTPPACAASAVPSRVKRSGIARVERVM
jgi:hypothetical protein